MNKGCHYDTRDRPRNISYSEFDRKANKYLVAEGSMRG